MAYNKVKYLKDSLKIIDSCLVIGYALTRCTENTDALLEMLEGLKHDVKTLKKAGTLLVKACERDRKALANALYGLAETFTDSELAVFEMYMFENKQAEEIANELGITLDYTKHIISRINRRIENEIEIKGEENA